MKEEVYVPEIENSVIYELIVTTKTIEDIGPVQVHGIAVYCKGYEGSADSVYAHTTYDVFCDKTRTEEILALFAKNSVLPIHAEDILLDLVSVS